MTRRKDDGCSLCKAYNDGVKAGTEDERARLWGRLLGTALRDCLETYDAVWLHGLPKWSEYRRHCSARDRALDTAAVWEESLKIFKDI